MIDGGGGNQAPPFLHPLKHFAEISSALASFASCEFAPAANSRFGKLHRSSQPLSEWPVRADSFIDDVGLVFYQQMC